MIDQYTIPNGVLILIWFRFYFPSPLYIYFLFLGHVAISSRTVGEMIYQASCALAYLYNIVYSKTVTENAENTTEKRILYQTNKYNLKEKPWSVPKLFKGNVYYNILCIVRYSIHIRSNIKYLQFRVNAHFLIVVEYSFDWQWNWLGVPIQPFHIRTPLLNQTSDRDRRKTQERRRVMLCNIIWIDITFSENYFHRIQYSFFCICDLKRIL